jgi:hypothetical protein
MNDLFRAKHLAAIDMPAEFEVLAPPPLLLPGENLHHYEALRRMIFADIAPRSVLEWLLAIEVAELSWEIQRYRLLRYKLLETYRQKAIEATLRRIDMIGIAPEFKDQAEFYTIQNALSWRLDPIATHEIEARLASYGFDQHSVSMEVHVQARELFTLFEDLLNGAQIRRLMILKEIKRQRSPVNAKSIAKSERSVASGSTTVEN